MPRAVRAVLVALAVAAIVAAGYVFDLSAYVTVDGMRALIARWEPYGPLVFMGICIAGILLHMPEIVFIAVGGIVFGPLLGFVYGWTASIVGTTLSFCIARYVLRSSVERSLRHGRFKRLQDLDQRLYRNGFRTVLVLRLLLFMAPPLNWALGISAVRLGHYVAATALGVVPGITLTVLSAGEFAEHGMRALLHPRTAIPIALAVAFFVAAAVLSRRTLARDEPS